MGIGPAAVMVSALCVAAANAAASSWAVDPSVPGSTRAVGGSSLFDEITADGVPFPYEALVRKIERATGCAPRHCTTSVLIPLGRSLQRTTALPEFFRYPRVVTAVTSEGATALFAKDRLFLGYQERADVIEVISYNEAAGRFEFQLVRDYRADGARRVVTANRDVCVSCHQNHAPIFSRQQWDETNANPQIASAIAAHQPSGRTSLYGVAIRGGVDLPNAIDEATDRANLIGVVQRIWRDACDRSCRAAAVAAAVQYRLSQQQGFAARTTVTAGFANAWPVGLAVPDPDLPNRDPLAIAFEPTPAGQVDVSAVFDALTPRAPKAVWKAGDAFLEARFVAELASMIAESDLNTIEGVLKKASNPRRTLHADCVRSGDRVGCKGEFAMTATGSYVERLAIGGIGGGELTGLSLRGGSVSRRGATARTTAGERIERLEVTSAAQGSSASLTLVEDFPVQRAMLDRAEWGEIFTRSALRRALGFAPTRPCCGTPRDSRADDEGGEPASGNLFSAPCGTCHRTAERTPPNFLAGDGARVDASLRHCAPRMFVRLAMWQLPASARAKVPMPPPRAAQDGRPHVQTRPDVAVALLQTTVAGWLRQESGSEPDVDALLARGYENLRPCLAPEARGEAR